jgi:hypothetical protein
MRYPGFVGPSNQALSIAIDDERTVNLMPVPNAPGKGRSEWALVNTPGLAVFTPLTDRPVRGMFGQDGRVFAVAGSTFFELIETLGAGAATIRGSVAQNADPACIESNGDVGNQLLITSGGLGYLYDLAGNTLSLMTSVDADFPATVRMCAFIDGYGLVLEEGTSEFFISGLYDFGDWDPLDFGRVSQSSDRTLSMLADHRELWLFGSKRTTVWYNSGNPDFPFEPIGGGFIEQGIIAPFSPQRIDNSIMWLGGGERGFGAVYRAQQFSPVRVSTAAVDHYLRRYKDSLEAAEAWTYQENGHSFYVLYIEGAETTFVYDAATNLWHERAIWDVTNGVWLPHVGRCHAFGFNKNLVGDRRYGTVYDQSLDYVSEELRVG